MVDPRLAKALARLSDLAHERGDIRITPAFVEDRPADAVAVLLIGVYARFLRQFCEFAEECDVSRSIDGAREVMAVVLADYEARR